MENEESVFWGMDRTGKPPVLAAEYEEGRGAADAAPLMPHMARLGISMLVLVGVGDYLLWGQRIGVSMGVYALVLAVAICLNRPKRNWRPQHGLQLALLVLAAMQTAVRPSLSNGLVIGVLLLVVAGDTALVALRTAWTRWFSAMLSGLAFIRPWMDFIRSIIHLGSEKLGGTGERLVRVLSVSWLALLLAVGFGLLLGSGNAMLRSLWEQGYDWLIAFVGSMTWPSFGRLVFWGLLGTVGLALLTPRVVGWTQRCQGEVPVFPVGDIKAGQWRSVLALLVVNGLFLMTNSLDAIYLWTNAALPDGVSYAEYVHSGVWSLILAVILSAVVMALIFQQDASVAGSRWVKGLALLWIAQNLLLEVGVLLRLTLYVDALWLTPKRVYVIVFLGLVVVGYGLLAFHVLANRFSLKRLILGNVLAVFCLFYLLQFINVPRLVADYDYRLWLSHPERNIMEMDLQQVLGAEMLPLAVRVAESGLDAPAVADAQALLGKGGELRPKWEASFPWQEWTLRKAQLRRCFHEYETADMDGAR